MSTPEETQVLVCEPVHNLVSRIILEPDGVTFRGRRHEDEQQSEFLASTDNWFRPVRVIEGADGSLLICDMYRMVIEHPQWIPEAWQDQLDLYAGHDMGRIYRLSPPEGPSSPIALRNAQMNKETEGGSGFGTAAASDLLESKIAESPGVLGVVLSVANKDDIRVRYRVALILGSVKDNPAIANVLLAIAKRDPDDPWIRTAVLSSSVPHALTMLRLLAEDQKAVAANARLLEGLIATALGEDVEQSAPLVVRSISRLGPNGAIEPWQPPALASFLETLERRGSSWDKVLGKHERERDRLTAMVEPIFAYSRETVRSAEAPTGDRVAALSLLAQETARRDEDIAFLASLLSPQSPVELQTAAVEVLARQAADRLPALLLANWKQHSPALRQTIVGTLLSRENRMQALASALEAGEVPPVDMDAATRQRLLTTWNGPVREAAARLYGAESQSDRAEVVAAFDGVRDLAGDPNRGAEVFKKVCSACHQHGGIGKDLAPQLSNLTNKSTDALLTAILDPNRAVEQKYQGYIVLTSSGRLLSGLIKSETGGSITLAEPNGTEHVILRIDIDHLEATGKSFMPEGLERDLSQQDLADVISFVQQPTNQPPPK
jgi:putative heme-binding domain-containing protein